jgi:hypothetical protein
LRLRAFRPLGNCGPKIARNFPKSCRIRLKIRFRTANNIA